MNRTEFENRLYARLLDRLKIPPLKEDTKRIVAAFTEELAEGLRREGRATLTGLGTFQVKPRLARIGHNPQTGEPITIKPGKRLSFTPGITLKKALR